MKRTWLLAPVLMAFSMVACGGAVYYASVPPPPMRAEVCWRRARTGICLGEWILGMAWKSARLGRGIMDASAACARCLGRATMGEQRRPVLFSRRTMEIGG